MNNIIDLLYKLSLKAYFKNEVPISCVIVHNNKVIAKAYNKKNRSKNPLDHAEIICLNKAFKKKKYALSECIMYVSHEPCCMCTGAILQSRIKKVFFYTLDKRNGSIISNNSLLDNIYTQKVEYEYIKSTLFSNLITKFFKEIRKKNERKFNT